MKTLSKRKLLIHRINRLIGQLESVREALGGPDPDCAKMSQTLSASSRSFASLRKAFFACLIQERYLDEDDEALQNDAVYQSLLRVINS